MLSTAAWNMAFSSLRYQQNDRHVVHSNEGCKQAVKAKNGRSDIGIATGGDAFCSEKRRRDTESLHKGREQYAEQAIDFKYMHNKCIL